MEMIRQITYGTGKYVHILCQNRLKDKTVLLTSIQYTSLIQKSCWTMRYSSFRVTKHAVNVK